MDIEINGERLDAQIDTEKTLGDVLVALEAELSGVGAAVIGVEVNGDAVADVAAAARMPLDEVTTVNVRAVTADELKAVLLAEKPEVEDIAKSLENLSVLLQSGKQKEADALIQKTSGEIQNLAGLVKFTSLFPDRFTALQDFFRDFTPLLSDFCTAIEDQDIVGIGDLGEYEIKPKLDALAKILAGL
jgi:hypothetical protein